MYGHTSSNTSSCLPPHLPPAPDNHLTPPPPPLPIIPHFDLDSATTHGGGGGGYDSPGYTGSQSDCIAPTPINNNGLLFQLLHLFGTTSSSSATKDGLSAGGGHLQGVNITQPHRRSESPFSNENDIIFESINKTCRYSPKEKRERIERYRNKKNQRNFNKKIKYVCRKTLADSRPRIKGRFARNDEIKRANNQGVGEEGFGEENVDNWMFNFYEPFSSNLIS